MVAIYEKIIKYIDEHIKDEITIEDISKIAGYSSSHIYKIFKYYTSMPIMEYIRGKKLYFAANEFYTGRKLYDIALDFGYETPAGFYKAFQTVFGCSPSEYKNNPTNKNNVLRSNIFMNIENIKNIEELDEGLEFFKYISKITPESDEKFGRNWWIENFNKNPELLLYAKDESKICAVVFGFADGGSITIHEGVLEKYKNTGIFEALFVEIEKRAKRLGYHGIALGIGEGEEEFYAKLGYAGSMLVQSEKHSVEKLKNFLENSCKDGENYEITGTNIYEGYINQLWLRISILDKEQKKRFEEELGDCWCQIIVGKSI